MKKTKETSRSALAVPGEKPGRRTLAPLMEDTRMPTVSPDEGTASYKRDFPWMKPQG